MEKVAGENSLCHTRITAYAVDIDSSKLLAPFRHGWYAVKSISAFRASTRHTITMLVSYSFLEEGYLIQKAYIFHDIGYSEAVSHMFLDSTSRMVFHKHHAVMYEN